MEPVEASEIETEIKEIARRIAPNLRYLPKYGGVVFALDPNDDGKFVGGVFCYKDHVSLEFSDGFSFDDPDKHLEGKGKKRRHLKLRAVAEVSTKDAAFYLKQALVP